MEQKRHVGVPVTLLVILKSSKHIKERLIKSFRHSIAHGVIRSGPRLINVCNGTQLLNNFAFKAATLVIVKLGREAIMADEIIKEDSGSVLC